MYIYNMNCILYIIYVYIWHKKIQVKFKHLVLLGGALWLYKQHRLIFQFVWIFNAFEEIIV